MITGRCECGAVAFEVKQVRKTITICHCSQCRRTSGHLWASTYAELGDLIFTKDDALQWYVSSETAKRGFCNRCGSSLFYRSNEESGIGIAAGCLDNTADMHIGKHIFVGSKGAYYSLPQDAEAFEEG